MPVRFGIPARNCELHVCSSVIFRVPIRKRSLSRPHGCDSPDIVSALAYRFGSFSAMFTLFHQKHMQYTSFLKSAVTIGTDALETPISSQIHPRDIVNITGMRDTCVRSFVCGLNTQEWFSIFRLIVLSHGVFYVYNDMNDVSIVFRTSRLVYPGM